MPDRRRFLARLAAAFAAAAPTGRAAAQAAWNSIHLRGSPTWAGLPSGRSAEASSLAAAAEAATNPSAAAGAPTSVQSANAGAAPLAAARQPAGAAAAPTLRKAVLVSMLPEELPWPERFALVRRAGFEAIEMQTVTDEAEAERIAEASRQTGLRIHSVMNADHWRYPLSSADRAVVDRSVSGMATSLRNARLWGADVVLLVPAVVDAATPYRDAWIRSQAVIRDRLLPLAAELKVVIAVEEVWNKFLLSPLEFTRYVDDFDSPWLKAYFDVGNVVFHGYPQDWIRTLGRRIVRLHLKDFHLDRPNGRFYWRNLGEGDVDWIEVRRALDEIGFSGYATTELAGGDEAYLRDVSGRVDRFVAGRPPVDRPAAGPEAGPGGGRREPSRRA